MANSNFIPEYGSFFERSEHEFENQEDTPNPKANIIEETLSIGRNLLDTNYLHKIIDCPECKFILPYVLNFQELNLYKLGWRLQYGTSKQWAGLCSKEDHKKIQAGNLSKNRNIYISIDFVKHDKKWKEQNMHDTILHEIAHGIVFEIFYGTVSQAVSLNEIDPEHNKTDGHGKVWGAVCAAISGKALCNRYYQNAEYEESFKNFKYECSNCGEVAYGNYLGFATTCRKCGKGVITEEN